MSAASVSRIDSRYDSGHDILYVLIGAPEPSSYSEDYPGILVRYSEVQNDVKGVTVMSFSRTDPEILRRHVPIDIDWDELRRQYLRVE